MHTPIFLLLLTLLKVFISSGLGLTNGTSPNLQNYTTCYGNQDRTKCTAFNSTHCRDHAGYYLKICTNTASKQLLIKLRNTDNNTHSKNNVLTKLHRKKRQIDSDDQSVIFKQAEDVPKNIPFKSSMPDNINLTEPSLSNFMAHIQNTALKNGDGVLNKFFKSNYKDTGFIPQIKGYKKVTYLIPEFEDENVKQKKNNDINLQTKPSVLQPKLPLDELELSANLLNIPAPLQKEENSTLKSAAHQPNLLRQKSVNTPQQPAVYQPNIPSLLQKQVNQQQPPTAFQPNLLWQKKVNQPQQPAVYKPNIPERLPKEVNPPLPPTAYQPNLLWQKKVNQPQEPAVYQPNIPARLQKQVNQPRQPTAYQPNLIWQKEVNQPQQPAFDQPNIPARLQKQVNQPQQTTAYQPNLIWQKEVNQPQQPAFYQPNIPARLQKQVNQPRQTTAYQPNLIWPKEVNQPQQPAFYQPNIPAHLQKEPQQPAVYQPNIPARLQKEVNQPQQPAVYQPNIPPHLQKEVNQPQQPYVYQTNIPALPQTKSVIELQQQSLQTNENVTTTEKSDYGDLFVKLCMPFKVSKSKNKSNILNIQILPSAIRDGIEAEMVKPNQSYFNKDFMIKYQHSKCDDKNTEVDKSNIPTEKNIPTELNEQFKDPPHIDVQFNKKPNYGNSIPKLFTNRQPNHFEKIIKYMYIPMEEIGSTVPREYSQTISPYTQEHDPNYPLRPAYNSEGHTDFILPAVQTKTLDPVYPKHMPDQTVQDPKRHLDILLPETHYDLSQIDPNYSTLYPNQAFHSLPYGNINKGIPKRKEKSRGVFGPSPQRDNQKFYNTHPQYGTHKNRLLNDFQKKKQIDIIMSETNGIENNVKPNWPQFSDKHGALPPNANGKFNTFEIPNSKVNNKIPKMSDREVFEQIPQIDVSNLYYSYIPNRPYQVGKEKEVPAPISKLGVPQFSQIYPKHMPHRTVQDPKRHLDILLPEMHYDLSQADPNYSTLYPNQAFHSLEIPYENINERIPKREEKIQEFGPSPQIGAENFYNIYPQYSNHKNGQLNDFQKKKHIDIMPETNSIENNVKPNWSQFNDEHGTLTPNANGQFNTFEIPNAKVNEEIHKMSDREVFEQIPQIDVPNLHKIHPKGTYQNRFYDPKKHTGASIPEYSSPASYLNRPYNTNENNYDKMPNIGSKGTGVFPSSPQMGMANLNKIPSLYGIQMPYKHKEINRVSEPKNHIDILLPETENGNPFIPKFSRTIPYAKENFNTVRTPKGNRNLISLSSYPQVNMPNRYEFDPKFDTQQPNYVGPSDPVQNPSKSMYVEKPSMEHNGKKASPHIDVLNMDKYYPYFNTQTGDRVKNINREIYKTDLQNKATPIPSPQNVYKLGPIYGTGIPYSSAQYSEIEDPNRYRYNLGLRGKENFNQPNSAYQTEILGYNGRLENLLRGNDPDLFRPDQHEFSFKKSDQKYLKPINIDSTQFVPLYNNMRPLSFSSLNFNRYDPKYQRAGKDETDPWKKVPSNSKNTLESSSDNQKLEDSPKFTQPTVIISNNNPVPAVYETIIDTVTTNKGYPTTLQTDHEMLTNKNLRPPNNAPVETDILIKNNHSTNSSNTSTSSSHSNQETNVQFTIQPTSFSQLKDYIPGKIIQNTKAVNLHQKHTFNAVPNENSISENQKYKYGTMLNFPKVESDSKDSLPDKINQSNNIDQLTSKLSKNKQQYLPGVVPTNNVQNEYYKSLKPSALEKANEMLPINNDLMQLNHNNLNKKLQPDYYAETMDPNIHYEKPHSLTNIYRQARDKFANGQLFNTKTLQKHDPKKAFYRDQVKHRDDTSYSKDIIKDPPWWADKLDGINWAKPDILKESSDNISDDTPKSSQLNTYFKDKIFKHGVITYSFAPVADESSKQLIREAVNKIQRDTCLLFREKKEDDDVNFQFVFIDGECCCATPKDTMRHQTVWMKRSCLQQPGGGLHALLHLLGLPHELRHQDRDEHLILYPNLAKPAYEWEFEKKLPKCASLNMPFDHKSVMNVPSDYGAINNETTVFYQKPEAHVVELNELSTIDIAKLHILYEDECKMRPQDFLDACY